MIVRGILAVLASASAVLLPTVALAAGAALSIYPDNASVTKGDNLTVTIRVDPGGNAINAVQANLTYPSDRFDKVTIASTADFPIAAQSVADNGVIKIARGTTGSVSTLTDVAVLTLHASSSGPAGLSFGDQDAVVRRNDTVNVLISPSPTHAASSSTSSSTTAGKTSSSTLAASSAAASTSASPSSVASNTAAEANIKSAQSSGPGFSLPLAIITVLVGSAGLALSYLTLRRLSPSRG